MRPTAAFCSASSVHYICPSCHYSLRATLVASTPASPFQQARRRSSGRSAEYGRSSIKHASIPPQPALLIKEVKRKTPWGVLSAARDTVSTSIADFFKYRKLNQDLAEHHDKEDIAATRPAWGTSTSRVDNANATTNSDNAVDTAALPALSRVSALEDAYHRSSKPRKPVARKHAFGKGTAEKRLPRIRMLRSDTKRERARILQKEREPPHIVMQQADYLEEVDAMVREQAGSLLRLEPNQLATKRNNETLLAPEHSKPNSQEPTSGVLQHDQVSLVPSANNSEANEPSIAPTSGVSQQDQVEPVPSANDSKAKEPPKGKAKSPRKRRKERQKVKDPPLQPRARGAAHEEPAHPQKAAAVPRVLSKTSAKEASLRGPNGVLPTDSLGYVSLQQAMSGLLVRNPAPTAEKKNNNESPPRKASDVKPTASASSTSITIVAADLDFKALQIEQPPVPRLSHDLDRVLFNAGVYRLQDPSSLVYNFDPYLQKIMPVAEFDFNALKEYKTSSEDKMLASIAQKHNKKYVGSTSSMTGSLAHFHYLLSNWRELNLSMLSRGFQDNPSTSFTELNRAPSAMFLRYKHGTYAIDADKQYGNANVLMLLGKSLEKLLTMTTSEFERYRKSDPREVGEQERNAPESFAYSTLGDFLMRSQLDAYDARLPGTGVFDLKTRAVVSVRMRSDEYQDMTGYQLHHQHGKFESYEREYHDMARSTLLKYSLQARMGRMDGIFMAYHNVERMFGFQYLNISEMDVVLHGQSDTCLGDQEFRLSVDLMNRLLDRATERFPKQSIRFHFETRPSETARPFMYVFAEPMSEQDIVDIQSSQDEKVAEYERTIMGVASKDPDLKGTEAQAAKEPGPQKRAVESTGAGARLSSSDAAADTTSAKSEQHHTSESNFRPLLAMYVKVNSTVNGGSVDRPHNLSPDDVWKVDYRITELVEPPKAWALYVASKERRRKSLEGFTLSAEERAARVELEKDFRDRKGRGDGFIEQLKALSLRGRAWRGEQDARESEMEKVVLGRPGAGRADGVGATSAGPVAQSEVESGRTDPATEDVTGVDDYMGWLYKR